MSTIWGFRADLEVEMWSITSQGAGVLSFALKSTGRDFLSWFEILSLLPLPWPVEITLKMAGHHDVCTRKTDKQPPCIQIRHYGKILLPHPPSI
ncbi:hypothetical protein PoB_002183300 [Plakobranchus ocellatus]|uniref:Uncharacterized protein n=1 Tax=Plakobranchus ocellatus TaxID=259542 RepID=A0AAV3ZKG4_9GAST|nr:hypothetical protein PoB_002183300 [Plakobranchus ocellatus]